MERQRGGYFIHESFTKLHAEQGSGWYDFTERVGMGGIFYLSSRGAFPYNPEDNDASTPHHDEYDILRAVEMGRATKLVKPEPATTKAEVCGAYYSRQSAEYSCVLLKGHEGDHHMGRISWRA